jgi:hypothetical protein
MRPFIVGVGGFTSNVGKTMVMCELLHAFPHWEAIKTTRGHYRSCGKEAGACCVSHLLSDRPLLKSGRDETYEPGKDTGRYWDAGAQNVHWLITTEEQVGVGIKAALARVRAEGVFVEGNSFTRFVQPDYFVMVRRGDSEKIKTSAHQCLAKASAIFVSGADSLDPAGRYLGSSTPIFTRTDFNDLIIHLRGALEASFSPSY